MTEKKKSHYSAPVQEIMGTVPSWIVRWGVSVILGILLIILVGACLIDYPLIVRGRAVVSIDVDGSAEGAMYIQPRDAVRLCSGQRVIVRLDAYPYMEYGVLDGILSTDVLSTLHSKDGILSYSVRIDFPNGSVSSSGHELDGLTEMEGDAEILIGKTKILRFLFDKRLSLY